jgi:hypothetical protein
MSKAKTETGKKSEAPAGRPCHEELGLCATRIMVNYQLARNCAAQAVIYAAKCGAVMNQAKELVGHGKFGKWLKKHCPAVTQRTATNYMALAGQIAHSAKLETVSNLNLLELPDPRDLKDGENDRALKSVRQITQGKTLTQLYEDFGIIKPRKTKGAEVREKLGPRTGRRHIDAAAEARLFVDQVVEKLEFTGTFLKDMLPEDFNRLAEAHWRGLQTMGVLPVAQTVPAVRSQPTATPVPQS